MQTPISEIEQLKAQIKATKANLDATTQLLNEHLTSNLQLRANLILLQEHYKESQIQVDTHKKQLKLLGDRIIELESARSVTGPESESPVSTENSPTLPNEGESLDAPNQEQQQAS